MKNIIFYHFFPSACRSFKAGSCCSQTSSAIWDASPTVLSLKSYQSIRAHIFSIYRVTSTNLSAWFWKTYGISNSIRPHVYEALDSAQFRLLSAVQVFSPNVRTCSPPISRSAWTTFKVLLNRRGEESTSEHSAQGHCVSAERIFTTFQLSMSLFLSLLLCRFPWCETGQQHHSI